MASSHSSLDTSFVKPFVSLQVLDSICVYTGAEATQHSLSVHMDKEQVIDPGLDFNEPEEQLWEVEEHVVGALQHSLSVHVDEEQVIDPGLDFNEPEEQLWEVEEHVAGADDDDCLHTHFFSESHGILIQVVVVQVLNRT